MDARQHSDNDEQALNALRQQLQTLLETDASPAVPKQAPRQAGEMGTMALQATDTGSFEALVQEQLARIGAQLEMLDNRLNEERGFAPQRPEEVPGYAELKTALHNLVEHLELAEGRTAEAIGHLHDKLEEVAARTSQAMQLAQAQGGGEGAGESLKVLEERIGALNARLEELRRSTEESTRAYVDSCIDPINRRLEQVERAPSAGLSADDIHRMIGEQVQAHAEAQAQRTEERMSALVARLQGKLEDLAAGVMDVERVRSDVERLDAQVRALSDQIEGKADRQETESLKQRLDALAAQLEAAHGAAPADDARVHALEEQVLEIRKLVEEALGEPLALIGEKLAAHEEQIASLRQDGGADERLAQMEQAIARLQEALRDGARPAEDGNVEDIAALQSGLQDLERFTRETDARTREMLQAVHETLAEVVERLIALEDAASNGKAGEKAAADEIAHGAQGDAASALLGEPAPVHGAVGAPLAAASAQERTESVEEKNEEAAPRHDLAGEVAQVIAAMQRDRHTTDDAHDAASGGRAESAQDAAPATAEVDDFIAAARRAALAAATRDSGDQTGAEAGSRGLRARLASVMPRSRKASGDSDAAARMEPAAQPLERADDGASSPGRLSMLASLRARKQATRQNAAAAAPDAGQKQTDGTRKRLMLAGLVLLSAAAVILTRPQTSQTTMDATVDATPAAVEATTQDDAHAVPGNDEAAPATAQPQADAPAPRPDASDRKKPDADADRQAALSDDAATGLFAPHAGGMPIHTSTIGALAAPGAGGAADHGASASRSTAVQADLPASIGPAALRNAALAGDGKAAYVVAARYLKGEGVPRDVARAVQWLRKAAEKGVVVAMYRLGAMHERGIGVRKDPLQARVWYERAALRGNVRAMHNLAVLSASGALGKADYEKAAYWFRKAAEHGVRDSQFNLAVLYHRGQGVPRSLADAWFWYSLAAAQGDAAAAEQASKLAAWLSAEELARMRQRLNSFKSAAPIRNANVVVIDRPEWRGASASVQAARHPGEKASGKELSGKALVAEVQKLLKHIGYDVGPVDGLMGNRTANAIRLFQMQSRLPVTGQPDMQLLQRLRQHVQQSS